jgi:hypothetical protein
MVKGGRNTAPFLIPHLTLREDVFTINCTILAINHIIHIIFEYQGNNNE